MGTPLLRKQKACLAWVDAVRKEKGWSVKMRLSATSLFVSFFQIGFVYQVGDSRGEKEEETKVTIMTFQQL